MRGVAARYPAFDPEENRPVDLQDKVNLCRRRHQKAPAWPYESHDLLALTAFLGKQSRGMPITPPDDPRLDSARERGGHGGGGVEGWLDGMAQQLAFATRQLGLTTVPAASGQHAGKAK